MATSLGHLPDTIPIVMKVCLFTHHCTTPPRALCSQYPELRLGSSTAHIDVPELAACKYEELFFLGVGMQAAREVLDDGFSDGQTTNMFRFICTVGEDCFLVR